MARVNGVPYFILFSIYFSCILFSFANASKDLDEDNWREVLEEEWMVEFYAPWCPACGALAPAWSELSTRLVGRAKVGAVDVTKAPGLTGRFMVTALPTIFHVKEGEFRQYKGPRDAESLADFVLSKRWTSTEAVPSWKAPDSLQMSLVAEFFKLSQVLRNVHNTLMETYGLPTWGSYLMFALATIVIGALLGLLLVCIIDLLYPPRRVEKVLVTEAEANRRAKGDDELGPEDLLHDDIVDDQDSDLEKNSGSDDTRGEGMTRELTYILLISIPPLPLRRSQNTSTYRATGWVDQTVKPDVCSKAKSSSSEGEAAAAGGDSAGEDKAPEVRKRRPRKAD